MCQDFWTTGLLGAEVHKFFFQKNFFFKNMFFSSNAFSKKKSFLKKKVLFWLKMLISAKLFIWHLSRKIVGKESAGKGTAVEKVELWLAGKGSIERASLILKLFTNSSCRLRARLEILIKVTSKADRWKESGESFAKKLISYCIFFINKKCFPLPVHKLFFPNPNAWNLQLAVSNFAAHRHELLAWTHRHELLAWARIRARRLFFLIVFGLYLLFGRKIHIYNRKKVAA